MRRILLGLIFSFFVVFGIKAQNFSWGVGAGNTGQDIGRAVATDAQNNVYQLIIYSGSLTIDSAGTPVTIGNYGNRDIAVIKYNCNKVYQWAIRIGGTSNDGGSYNSSGIASDTSGNIFIHTTIGGNANITSSNGSNTTKNIAGSTDALLIKANNMGIVSWVTQMGGSGADESGGVAIDREQNIYITGSYSGTASFTQTSGGSSNWFSFGSSDIYIAKYRTNGTIDYINRSGGNLTDVGLAIDVDSSGNVYVCGNWGCCGNSFSNFGNNVVNTGNWGAFLAKADSDGSWIWGVDAGSSVTEGFSDVVVDDIKNQVYVIGHFNGNSSLTSRPPGSALNINTNGGYDLILAAYNLNGSLQWARTLGGTGNEYGYGVDLDPATNPIFVGEIRSTTSFGGTPLTPTGATSAFYAKYTSVNTFIEAQKIAAPNIAGAQDVHVSSSGLTYVAGLFRDSLTVGLDVIRNNGLEDGFVVRKQDTDTTIIYASNTNLDCTGDTTYLYILNKSKGTFAWYRNDTLIANTNGTSIFATLPGTYKVVSSSNCSPSTTSNSIVVVRSPYFTAPRLTSITICNGDSARLNASGGATYSWTPNIAISDVSVGNPYVKPTFNMSYYLTTTLNGCTSLDTVPVIIQNNCCLTCSSPYRLNQGLVACYPFTGNANDQSGYGNNAQVFNATLAQDRFNVNNRAYQFNGFSSYLEVPNSASLQSPTTNMSFTFWARVTSWNFSGGVQFNPVVSKSTNAASAQYRAMIRNNGAYAMVNSNSYNAIIGSNVNTNTWYFFTITVSNDTLYYYRNGTLLGSATGPVPYVLNNTTPLRIGRNDVNSTSFFSGQLDELRIYGRTLTGTEVRDLYNLSSINGLPTINAGTDKTICKDDTVQLTTTGSNGTWQWTPNYMLSSDTARSPLSHPDTSNNYVVKVEFSGCKNYDTVRVNVVDYLPDLGSDRSVCLGDSSLLIVNGGGTSFAWTPNYKISSTNNDSAYVFPLVDTSYIVTATLGICTRKDTVRVSVITPTLDVGVDKNICDGDTARFTVTTNGTARWTPTQFLNDSVGTNIYSLPNTNITYYVNSTYLGCKAYDTVSVSVSSLPVDAGPNQVICLGDTVQLQATGSTNYIWLPSVNISDSSLADPFVWPTVPTYYYAISYNMLCSRYDSVFIDVKQAQANAGLDKTICNGDSIPMTATALGSHIWSPLLGLGDTTLTAYAKPTVTTNYVLKVTNATCEAYDTVRVTVANLFVDAGSDKSICKGDSVQLFASGSTKYNWLPLYNISDTGVANPWVKPLFPLNYLVFTTNGICLKVDTVFVDVTTFSGSAGIDTSMCEGRWVDLQASGGAGYEWLNLTNISDRYIYNPKVTPPSTQDYYVKIFDGGNCYIYDTVNIVVNKFPTLNAGVDYKHCPGESVTLLGSVSDYDRFEWSPALGLNDKLLLQPTATAPATTVYKLEAWNGSCYNYDEMLVEVNPPVVASFTPNPDRGLAPLPVSFNNSSSYGYFSNWDFGDLGAGSTDQNPTYIYANDGIYTVTLVASDSLGCTDTTTAKITVTSIEAIFAPSAFTPDGNGLNDVFQFKYNPNRFEFVELSIYNRWGVMVFETRMPGGIWWDGKVNGVPEPPGIFTYVGYAKDKKGKSYELNGTISLVR
ncbi:MAG: gliding motility-associated C-terminal domain-containing protein [Bacteroidia bacterium]|nr:gliding motility-associated C-terminal domain-containing protein [Bacteroidia bacterium]